MSRADHSTHQGWADGDALRALALPTDAPDAPSELAPTDRDRERTVAMLASSQVIDHGADVATARERARRRRLLWLAIAVVLVGAGLALRSLVWHHAGIIPFPHVSPSFAPYLPGVVLLVVLVVAMVVSLLGGGRSPHVLYRPSEIDVHFDDVKGCEVVVEEVRKTLNLFLAHRTFAEKMGGTPRRAILFEGPPGTGKTYLAKALAGEAGVPFLFVSSSAFQSMYYGATNRKIRAYFRAMRRFARREGGAIGFIEEIDAIGASRGGRGFGHREGIAGVVNELLIQLQSFDAPTGGARFLGALVDFANQWLPRSRQFAKPSSTPANILVIGATNRADDLDSALLRPGRFDRSIYFDLPTRAGRREIIDYYLDKKAHTDELDDPARREALAGMTAGYSPVMVEHLLDEALVWALRRGSDALAWGDITRAKMTNEIGLANGALYTEAERRLIATHEAGHATVAWLVGRGRTLDVLTIVKRKESLGLLAHSDTEERFTRTRSEMQALIQIAMGGMAAEELFFGETSSGVAGDLAAATSTACQMVGVLGMGSSLIVDTSTSLTSPDVAAKVLSNDAGRDEVDRLLSRSKDEARSMLSENRHVVEALRDALLDREELVGPEITAVIQAARPDPAAEPRAETLGV